MEKIIYLTFFCFILVFAFGCKTEKIQKKQKTIEKKTTDIDICKRKETTKLHLAAKNSNDPEEIIALIKDGADINACDSEGKMPIHWAAWKNKNLSVLEALIKEGANINVYTEPPIELFIDKKPPLNYAIIGRNLDAVNLLIQAGADVNLHEKNRAPALSRAISYGDIFSDPDTGKEVFDATSRFEAYKIVKTLIQAGANVNNVNDVNFLFSVVTQNKKLDSEKQIQIEIIEMLIQAGADIKKTSSYHNYETPLHGAAGFNTNPKVIEVLVRAGADIHAENKFGETPLLIAIDVNNAKAFFALIKAGANSEINDNYEKISKEIINKKFTPSFQKYETAH